MRFDVVPSYTAPIYRAVANRPSGCLGDHTRCAQRWPGMVVVGGGELTIWVEWTQRKWFRPATRADRTSSSSSSCNALQLRPKCNAASWDRLVSLWECAVAGGDEELERSKGEQPQSARGLRNIKLNAGKALSNDRNARWPADPVLVAREWPHTSLQRYDWLAAWGTFLSRNQAQPLAK